MSDINNYDGIRPSYSNSYQHEELKVLYKLQGISGIQKVTKITVRLRILFIICFFEKLFLIISEYICIVE